MRQTLDALLRLLDYIADEMMDEILEERAWLKVTSRVSLGFRFYRDFVSKRSIFLRDASWVASLHIVSSIKSVSDHGTVYLVQQICFDNETRYRVSC